MFDALRAYRDSSCGVEAFGEDPDDLKTKDEVLDNMTLDWLTNTATSAGLLYSENRTVR